MNLNDKQRELEDLMVSKGAARFAEEQDRSLVSTAPGEILLRKATQPMVDALEAVAGRGRPKPGLKLIAGLDPHILTDLTARRLLDCAAKEEALIKTCKAIAKAVEWHVRDAELHAASIAIWNKTQQRLKKTNNPEFRRKSIDGTVQGIRRWAEENAPDLAESLTSVEGLSWDIDTQIDVGSALIDLFVRSTKMVVIDYVTRGKRDRKAYVRLTEGTEEWLREKNLYYSVLRPVHLPMVVKPRNWVQQDRGWDGGYLNSSKAGVSFIKTRAQLLDRDTVDMTQAYDAVNAMQRTPWRVNRAVLDVMQQCWLTGNNIGGLPPKYYEDAARPLPPMKSRLQDMTPEQRKADPEYKAWCTKARAIHEHNADMRAVVKEFGNLLSVAGDYVDYPAFYHPHKLDWRQRAYPISVFMSPQGDQFNRALIEFAYGRRMGDSENAGAWLAIHGANCFGVDKVSFEERIAWVEENHDLICDSAMLPFDSPFWTKADKPWPFLAFCMEWLAYTIAGDDHVTHLPVALDGSNSGLQHLSAMLRDGNGARITCVSPGPKPEDVYQMVADEVEATLAAMIDGEHAGTHESDEWAAIWAGKVVRKIAKQPTMTYTYSATERGMRDQIVSALRDLDSKAETGSHLAFTTDQQSNSSAADYLAPIMRRAIGSQMQKAEEAMVFLQQVARVYSQTGLPLRWTTPLGVPVVQYYPTAKSERKNIFIDGTRHRLTIKVDIAGLQDKKKAAAGVSPNLVHSMDSTHLLWTILACHNDHQMECFSMIHDSFGTHATDCDILAAETREQFVRLYSEDRLRLFRDEVAEHLSRVRPDLIEELPDVPTFGTFDITSVRKSDYFFA